MKYIKQILVLLFSILIISSTFGDPINPLKFLAGVWNPSEGIIKLNNEWKNNEEAQPTHLECNGLIYSGWPNYSIKVETTNKNYPAVIDSWCYVENIDYVNNSIQMQIAYTAIDSRETHKTVMKVHIISNNEIWFEPDPTDKNLLDLLSLYSFDYGFSYPYIRASLWNKYNN